MPSPRQAEQWKVFCMSDLRTVHELSQSSESTLTHSTAHPHTHPTLTSWLCQLIVIILTVNVLNIHSEDDDEEPTETGGEGGEGGVNVRVSCGVCGFTGL